MMEAKQPLPPFGDSRSLVVRPVGNKNFTPAMELGKNLLLSREGDSVVLLIDLTKTVGPSSSGVTELIATTSGNKPLGQTGATLGFNLYVKKGPDGKAPKIEFKANEEPVACGMNTSYTVSEGGTMKVFLHLTKAGRPSSSGKTTLVATANEKGVAGTSAVLNVNCYTSDPANLSLDKIDAPADFTFEFAKSDNDPHVTMKATLEGPDGTINRRIAVIPGHPATLKVAANLSWDNYDPAANANTEEAPFEPVPGADNLQFKLVKSTLYLRFNGSELGSAERCGTGHLHVAGTRPKEAAATNEALGRHGGKFNLHVAVLRPKPDASKEQRGSLLSTVPAAVDAFLAKLTQAEIEQLTFKDVRDHVEPLLVKEAKDAGVAFDPRDPDVRAALKTIVQERLTLKVAGKRDRDG